MFFTDFLVYPLNKFFNYVFRLQRKVNRNIYYIIVKRWVKKKFKKFWRVSRIFMAVWMDKFFLGLYNYPRLQFCVRMIVHFYEFIGYLFYLFIVFIKTIWYVIVFSKEEFWYFRATKGQKMFDDFCAFFILFDKFIIYYKIPILYKYALRKYQTGSSLRSHLYEYFVKMYNLSIFYNKLYFAYMIIFVTNVFYKSVYGFEYVYIPMNNHFFFRYLEKNKYVYYSHYFNNNKVYLNLLKYQYLYFDKDVPDFFFVNIKNAGNTFFYEDERVREASVLKDKKTYFSWDYYANYRIEDALKAQAAFRKMKREYDRKRKEEEEAEAASSESDKSEDFSEFTDEDKDKGKNKKRF